MARYISPSKVTEESMEFDVPRNIEAVGRSVADREHDGQTTRAVLVSRDYPTDIDDLWNALTDETRIPRWFAPVSGEFRLGGSYRIEGNASGTISECEPPHRLALTWEFAGNMSWVFITLSDIGAATRLELVHLAPRDEKSEEFWKQYGPGATGIGWELGLLGLAEHIERGWNKPPEIDMSWLKSDNYRSFIAASSEGWRDASVAYGTDAKAAAEAGERTTRFYTGG